MYYTYNRISKKVYDYCLKQKIADALLIAKWKKPGYERLCSTYVINPSNYKFGTTSICRVPIKDRGENAKNAIDPTTGCHGCASGMGAGPRNIFGNKYGQNLAAVQIARENRIAAMEVRGIQLFIHDNHTFDKLIILLFFILLIVTGEEGSNPTTERNGRRAK